jgi:hypothetical protein
MVKELLRKYLVEFEVDEALRTQHFDDREKEVVDNIVDITLPNNVYLPNVPIEQQKAWIIQQIQKALKVKINAVVSKTYPKGKGLNLGVCSVAPLGMIKLQPLKGLPINILVTAQRKEGLISGYSYYITIYDDRLPSLVLADKNNKLTQTPAGQLQAHMDNNIKRGDAVNKKSSFIDKSFIDNIVINLSDFQS